MLDWYVLVCWAFLLAMVLENCFVKGNQPKVCVIFSGSASSHSYGARSDLTRLPDANLVARTVPTIGGMFVFGDNNRLITGGHKVLVPCWCDKVCSLVSSTWGLQCVLAASTTPSDSAWKKCLVHSRCQRATENSGKTRAPTPSPTRRTRVTVRMTSTWKTLRGWLWLKKTWNSWRRTTTCLRAVGQPPATSATESVGF